MSKKAKSAAKLKRKAMKRARKQAMKEQYQKWAAAGQNRKTARARRQQLKQARVGGLASHQHKIGLVRCGNIGCKRCSPLYQPGGALFAA